MKKNILKMFLLSSSVLACNANAAWLTSTGYIEALAIYDRHQIIVTIKDNDGAPVAACRNKTQFIIPASYSEEARNRMYIFGL